ncbi:MAG: tetratricopeptide repeat protein [Deltaproteobacteria bacterium]|nr:tetratricopeptide repeat protein [Deltaproteobacteria bacterium]
MIHSRENGFTKYEGKALQGIGALYLQMDMNDEALITLESALLLHEEMGDRRGEAMDRLFIGMIHRTSSPEKAEECLRRARTISQEIGDPIIYNKANHLLSRGFKL